MRSLGCLAGALALAATTAHAAPNIVNTSQKGSLLIFADIDVRGAKTTIVRLVNDGDSDVKVKCIFADAGNLAIDPGLIRIRNWTDFVITLTPRQAIWLDAKTGRGSSGNGTANAFPAEFGQGELLCLAVTNGERNKRKFNHLAGTATVMDMQNGTAYEYTAHAFYLRTLSNDPGTLALDGVEYDSCPSYLIGIFDPGALNRVTIASCTQHPRQDGPPSLTKLEFEVWNGNAVKFTGAYSCMDTWAEAVLGQPGVYNYQNFTKLLGTSAAYYRVRAVSSIRCTGPTAPAGLIAVQSTSFGLGPGADPAAVGSGIHHAGSMPGVITWEQGSDTAEGRVR